MVYQIGDECLHCGMCEAECPNSAIAMDSDQNYRIDPQVCIGCGTCAEICPTENIQPIDG